MQVRRGTPVSSRPSSPQQLTKPQPFRLASVERHERYVAEVLPRSRAAAEAEKKEEARRLAKQKVRCRFPRCPDTQRCPGQTGGGGCILRTWDIGGEA